MRWGHLSSLVMMPNHKSSQLRVNVGWWGSASLGAMMSIPSSVSEVRLPIQRGIVAKREQSQILRVRRVETCWRSSSGRDTDSNEEAVANINSRSTTSLTFIGTVSEGREEHSFKNRTGPAGPSTGHGSGPVRWIRPEDDWTEIGPDEPAVRPVPSEPNGSTFFFLQHQRRHSDHPQPLAPTWRTTTWWGDPFSFCPNIQNPVALPRLQSNPTHRRRNPKFINK